MSKLPITKFQFHATFKTESKAQKFADGMTKGSAKRRFFVKKRTLRTVSGGTKVRFSVASVDPLAL